MLILTVVVFIAFVSDLIGADFQNVVAGQGDLQLVDADLVLIAVLLQPYHLLNGLKQRQRHRGQKADDQQAHQHL